MRDEERGHRDRRRGREAATQRRKRKKVRRAQIGNVRLRDGNRQKKKKAIYKGEKGQKGCIRRKRRREGKDGK